jgi:hypothetical protein
MVKRYGLATLFLSLCLILCAAPAWTQWARNGVLVCGEDNNQYYQKIIPDGAEGAIIVWMDYRSGSEWDIYGNRVEKDGNVYGSGLPVCTAAGDQGEPQIIPDGTGGAIAVWLDFRSGSGYYDIYAQRVDGTGTARWTADGIPICVGSFDKPVVRIVPDGSGGGIIVWADTRRGGQSDIYAQHVTGDGDTLWAANGMPVDTSVNDQWSPEVVSDGAGGAIIVWIDSRTGGNILYGQRIDGDGNLLWGPNAVQLCSDGTYQTFVQVVAASGGGACLSWEENRYGNDEVFAQKLDEDGNVLWQADGVIVCPYHSSKYDPQLAEDGSGGAILAWYDERDLDNYPVYAQRIDADGNLAWSPDGIMVFPRYGDCDPRITADGAGGMIAALDMYLDDNLPTDIYAQRLDHDGSVLWGPKGAAVCLAPEGQYCTELTTDGRGGAIITWYDYRANDGYCDIWAQRVGPSGLWGSPEPAIVSCLDVPQDQGGWVRVRTRASSHDSAGENDTPIFGYNVWREITGGGGGLAASAATAKAPALDRSKLVALLSDPTTAKGVRVNAPQAASLGLPAGDWEAVGFWFATRDTMYNIAVPTKDDSTEAGTPLETYIVTAHSSQAGIFVASEPAQGYSVDNLAPGTTGGFAGNETASPAGLQLSWTPNSASDLWKYDVYRGTDELFVPGPANLLGSTSGTGLHDGTWMKASHYFYKLIAVDRHGNMSPAALLRPEDVKVGTLLTSFAAELRQSAIEVWWRLSDIDGDAAFHVLRSSEGGDFAELPSVEIARDALAFSVVDRSVEPGTTYRYRVDIVDGSGRRELFETDAISTPAIPLTLYQNHPNPFNPTTTIGYYLPAASEVTLDVYDSAGHLVSRLVDGVTQERGTHSVEWGGLDAAGRRVSSGVYFSRLRSGKNVLSRKMILLR